MNIPVMNINGRNFSEWMIASILPNWLERLSIDYSKALKTVTQRDLDIGQNLMVRLNFPAKMPLREAIRLLKEVYRGFINTHEVVNRSEESVKIFTEFSRDIDSMRQEEIKEKAYQYFDAVQRSPRVPLKEYKNETANKMKSQNHPKQHKKRRPLSLKAVKYILTDAKGQLRDDPSLGFKKLVEQVYADYEDAKTSERLPTIFRVDINKTLRKNKRILHLKVPPR
jgi:hypothetical protein